MTLEELKIEFMQNQLLVECETVDQRRFLRELVLEYDPYANTTFIDDSYDPVEWPYFGYGLSAYALYHIKKGGQRVLSVDELRALLESDIQAVPGLEEVL